jgi:hypothetical protein
MIKTGQGWVVEQMCSIPFQRQVQILKDSFMKIDKKFFYVVLLELLLLSLIFAGSLVWNRKIVSISQDIEELQNQLNAIGGLSSVYGVQMRDDTAVEIFTRVIFSSVIFALFALIAWTLIKNRIYNIATKTKFSKSTYWRFLVMTIVWGIVSFLLFGVVQYFTYMAFGRYMDTSFASRVAAVFILSFVFLILFWFTLNLFTRLVTKGKMIVSIKSLFRPGLTGFADFLVPLACALVAFAVVNLLMYLFMMLKMNTLFVILSTILLMMYLTWLRFYYTRVITELAAEKKPQKSKFIIKSVRTKR